MWKQVCLVKVFRMSHYERNVNEPTQPHDFAIFAPPSGQGRHDFSMNFKAVNLIYYGNITIP